MELTFDLRRKIDTAIGDFLLSRPLDAARLVQHLEAQQLAIVSNDEDQLNEADNRLVLATVSHIVDELREVSRAHFIDVDTREHVEGLYLEDAIAAAERAWSDGE